MALSISHTQILDSETIDKLDVAAMAANCAEPGSRDEKNARRRYQYLIRKITGATYQAHLWTQGGAHTSDMIECYFGDYVS